MRYKLSLIMLAFGLNLFAKDYIITDYGAIPNGNIINTIAIQRAIDLCSESGGKVIVPKGTFITGTIVLKDNVTLELQSGAKLLGASDLTSYTTQNVDFHFWGEEWAHYALITAHNAKNISIIGKGTIDGQGSAFKLFSRKKPDKYKNRPYLIWFSKCSNITLRDVTLRNSGFWMQYYLCCDDVNIDGIRVFNHSNKNNDMIDIDGCHNVTITKVVGDSDDDGITLKSTCQRKNENITISDCILSSHCNALKLGTESTGGFRNVTISNIIIKPSKVKTVLSGSAEGISGISLEVADGGLMENIILSNIIVDSTEVPLFVRLCNRGRKYFTDASEPEIGSIRHIQINGLKCFGISPIGCSITGIPNGIVEDITLTNCSFDCFGDIRENMNQHLVLEMEKEYPESTNFGILPSYGLYIRHCKGVNLYNVQFNLRNQDSRPAIICEDVNGLQYDNLMLSGEKGGEILVKK